MKRFVVDLGSKLFGGNRICSNSLFCTKGTGNGISVNTEHNLMLWQPPLSPCSSRSNWCHRGGTKAKQSMNLVASFSITLWIATRMQKSELPLTQFCATKLTYVLWCPWSFYLCRATSHFRIVPGLSGKVSCKGKEVKLISSPLLLLETTSVLKEKALFLEFLQAFTLCAEWVTRSSSLKFNPSLLHLLLAKRAHFPPRQRLENLQNNFNPPHIFPIWALTSPLLSKSSSVSVLVRGTLGEWP